VLLLFRGTARVSFQNSWAVERCGAGRLSIAVHAARRRENDIVGEDLGETRDVVGVEGGGMTVFIVRVLEIIQIQLNDAQRMMVAHCQDYHAAGLVLKGTPR
jgi:hypothetical protein